MIRVRFMTLEGKFALSHTEEYEGIAAATAAVETYAHANGFTKVARVDDGEEPDSWRYTAKTPGGRSGRNIAFADDMGDDPYTQAEVDEGVQLAETMISQGKM